MSYRCPNCNHGGMNVSATMRVSVDVSGDGCVEDYEESDIQWEDDDAAFCCECSHQGRAEDFWENGNE